MFGLLYSIVWICDLCNFCLITWSTKVKGHTKHGKGLFFSHLKLFLARDHPAFQPSPFKCILSFGIYKPHSWGYRFNAIFLIILKLLTILYFIYWSIYLFISLLNVLLSFFSSSFFFKNLDSSRSFPHDVTII